jgi:Cu-Zn family superoxide dismutase
MMTSSKPALLVLCALLVAAQPGAVMGKAKPRAVADLVDAAGKSHGRAILTESADGLSLVVKATGLAAGAHGLHVHAIGKCDAPDFASAGGHWNPTAHQHGHKNPQGPHGGDAPNLVADAHGKAKARSWLGAGALSAGAAPLLDADGAAVVIHADPDDEMTDPSGKSGKRVLCGVLKAR